MFFSRPLDHIVYAVPDFDVALDWFEEHTGIRPKVGGRHLTQGTRNAVVNLGNGIYLEILAVDPTNKDITAPRWMGIDLISKPVVSRWAFKTANTLADANALRTLDSDMGSVEEGQRQLSTGNLLKWEIIMPLAEPAIDILPFFVNWSSSDFHPTERMPKEYTLEAIRLQHPEPDTVMSELKYLGVETAVTKAETVGILMDIRTPKGLVTL
jgi:hypothetical protein